MTIIVKHKNIENALLQLKKLYEKNGLREYFKHLKKYGYQTKGQKRRQQAMRSRARQKQKENLKSTSPG